MLAFDAFIGNEDRHENNFDVIVRDGKIMLRLFTTMAVVCLRGQRMKNWLTRSSVISSTKPNRSAVTMPSKSRWSMSLCCQRVTWTSCIVKSFSPSRLFLHCWAKKSICDPSIPEIPSALPESRHGVIKWPIWNWWWMKRNCPPKRRWAVSLRKWGRAAVQPPTEPFHRWQTWSSIGWCGGLGKETNLSEKSDGLQGNSENDGSAELQCMGNRQTHQRLPDGRPYWLRFSEDETFEDTTRGRARRIMNENQKNSW